MSLTRANKLIDAIIVVGYTFCIILLIAKLSSCTYKHAHHKVHRSKHTKVYVAGSTCRKPSKRREVHNFTKIR